MSSAGSQLGKRKGIALGRMLITINFVLFLVLISPFGRSRQLYSAIRDAGFGALATIGLPLWFAVTTVVATALYFLRGARKSDPVEQPKRTRILDGALLLLWWIVLIVTCLYAFMMGMGG